MFITTRLHLGKINITEVVIFQHGSTPGTFRKEGFLLNFSLMYIIKINGPRDGANFDPRAII
jgi:hypothetical protein